jgi:hypothetical protein
VNKVVTYPDIPDVTSYDYVVSDSGWGDLTFPPPFGVIVYPSIPIKSVSMYSYAKCDTPPPYLGTTQPQVRHILVNSAGNLFVNTNLISDTWGWYVNKMSVGDIDTLGNVFTPTMLNQLEMDVVLSGDDIVVAGQIAASYTVIELADESRLVGRHRHGRR